MNFDAPIIEELKTANGSLLFEGMSVENILILDAFTQKTGEPSLPSLINPSSHCQVPNPEVYTNLQLASMFLCYINISISFILRHVFHRSYSNENLKQTE